MTLFNLKASGPSWSWPSWCPGQDDGPGQGGVLGEVALQLGIQGDVAQFLLHVEADDALGRCEAVAALRS